jgi:hypothetical protein
MQQQDVPREDYITLDIDAPLSYKIFKTTACTSSLNGSNDDSAKNVRRTPNNSFHRGRYTAWNDDERAGHIPRVGRWPGIIKR